MGKVVLVFHRFHAPLCLFACCTSSLLPQSLANNTQDGCQAVVPIHIGALIVLSFWTVTVVTAHDYNTRIQAQASTMRGAPDTPGRSQEMPAIHRRGGAGSSGNAGLET